MHLNFRSLTEERPGDALRQAFEHGWPGWSAWMRKRRSVGAKDERDARLALRQHMPEFENLWDNWLEVCGDTPESAVFLSFWSPPRYLVHCSQAVLSDDHGPLLIRNYDLDPKLNESTLLSTNWRGRRVAGMVEGIVGLADGMNDAGLAASLTFGGRTVSSKGFGIPLIIRYVLEMCADVQQAVEALRAVPCHMSYNVTVADAAGEWATVMLAPDRPAIVTRSPFTTNHQLGVEWPRHGRFSNTEGRADHLEQLFENAHLTAGQLIHEFLTAPLASTGYDKGFGTIYTAAYRPEARQMSLHWMDGAREDHALENIMPRERLVHYTPTGSQAASPQPRKQCAEHYSHRNAALAEGPGFPKTA
ncbi:C45 family autoproteolytic acyltransferase/hydrolase [Sulfitobacter sp. F26204]|uniref:C45 family autoproteolytic acyltransferase/hydolase n=1 Tax=Sulfitobacter sp. F26204 TaxID=2996014 RepID=UPI00225E404D|nr:C45 family peptidase [Sulfitobacter sp. F26204]MCX7561258.1 C45 family autoproteolytic acyltransferase/hydrolase [Sulfitobacter sp. F26204]